MKTKWLAAAAALAALAAPIGANAATVVGAKSVVVTSALPDYLQVGEVLAFTFGGTNVALASNGGVATASSQYGPEGGPAEANDGAYPVNYDYPVGGGTSAPGVFHSLGAGSGEFLKITFANAVNLASLTVYGRGDCCQTRDKYNVKILDANGATLFSTVLDATTQDTNGRYIGFATTTFDRPAGVVPEPATWALMIGGFGLAGVALRRRAVAA